MKKRMAVICAAMMTVLMSQFAAGIFTTSLVKREAIICIGFTLASLLIVRASERFSIPRDTSARIASKKEKVRAVLLFAPPMLAGCYLTGVITNLIYPSGAGSIDLSSPIETAIIAIVIAPIFEEIFIRRAVLSVLKPVGNIFAIIISSVCFSLMHINLNQLPYAFVAGIFLGAAAIRTGSVLPPIILHACNNALSVTLSLIALYHSEKVSIAAAGIYISLLLLLCAACAIYVCSKHFERTVGTQAASALSIPRETTLGKDLLSALCSPLLIYILLTLTLAMHFAIL